MPSAKGADAGWRSATDINVMREAGDVTEKFVLVIHGRHEGDVVEVNTSQIGMVRQDSVTGTEVFDTVFADSSGNKFS